MKGAAVTALVLFATAFAFAPVAKAQGTRAEAEARFLRAVELYKAGDYASALTEFRSAHESARNFRVLYNIASLEARLGDAASAVRTYGKYLSEGGSAVPSARRAEVVAEIKTLEAKTGKIVVQCEASGVEIAVGDTVVGTTPMSEPIVVNAGARRVTASKPGHAHVVTMVDVPAGGSVALPLSFDPPKPPAPRVSEPVRAGNAVPWAAWVGTGALAGATVASGLMASSRLGDYDAAKARFGVTRAELEDSQRAARVWLVSTAVLGLATVVVGGLSLHLTLARSTGRERVDVAVGPASVGFKGVF